METHLDWIKVCQERSENPNIKGETSKAHARRLREGWYDLYAPSDQTGIDIGCQNDPLNHTFRRFDYVFGDGDATLMEGVPDNLFMSVYSSHVLEHLKEPVKAVRRWYEITKPGGCLIICVPHRDLYERKKLLPSNWNNEHEYFWLPEEEEPPCTKSLKKTVLEAIPDANIISFRVLDEGYDYSVAKNQHAVGEYAIECIVRKRSITQDH